jgi:AcrR family transcriptional regulator
VPPRGRPRDTDLDERILDVARRHLARCGYEGMSLVAVAEEAGTTRQALYRRWPSKADLATAAIAAMAGESPAAATGDPYSDLVAELGSFEQQVQGNDGLSMVGTMLIDAIDPQLVALYREQVVLPRRARLRTILERARHGGQVDADADVELAVSMLTGSWYARALAGDPAPPDWPRRAALLAWRALGGSPRPL